jgi:phospholipid-binding lipoprotein MlaA
MRASTLVVLSAVVLVSGCATTAQAPSRADPLEAFNRAMYAVHEPIDRVVVRPAVQAYVDIVPLFIRRPVANFFGNIEDLFSGINGVLQGKTEKASHDFGRVMANSLIGLGGLIDVASDVGIPRGEEDFGQTFGHWGFPQGPYVFVPLFGPTTVRDGAGWIVRAYTTPVNLVDNVPVRNTIWGVGYVDLRAQALETQSLVDKAALDPYTFIRRSYLQRREYLTYDGRPPSPKEDDE